MLFSGKKFKQKVNCPVNILEKGQDRQVNNNTKNKYHIAPKNCTKPPYKENQETGEKLKNFAN
jgi:hypothetical protein